MIGRNFNALKQVDKGIPKKDDPPEAGLPKSKKDCKAASMKEKSMEN